MGELPGHSVIMVKGSKTAPSLLYNNLSMCGPMVAYVHKAEVVLIDITKPDSPVISHPIGGAPAQAVHQVKLVPLGSRLAMLVACTDHLQIWDAEKESRICSCNTDSGEVYLSRGIAALPGKGDSATIFVGHSTGSISVIDYQAGDCKLTKTLSRHGDCVSDVCAGDAEGVGAVIASADIAGELVLWGEDLNESASATFQGDTLTSVHVTGPYVAAAFGSGRLRLYSAKGCAVCCEIAAHSRWIPALSVHPESNLMASVSEDMLLCVWRTPCKANGGKVQLLGHRLLQDCLLTGVQISEDGRRVCVNAYDWDRFHMFDLPS
eukprot:TRINITY_DN3767_c3_g1_i1.p1 TRINITY_DN3767_c3_g1~~TRINITY_DN3767_c3_g1_i1.p1  ORF type:complete len:362 (+),score=108.94 TRINITY_DN3767_c3_g1_i1:126-1088(+)